ncbi:hypothetical protein [Aquimarina sp. 2201CG5-10]|uniref:hypothetical protein n=1 Tax=Aquimarina callyspongiae TaxID=3098150 RepID=UPI002AB38040|nr:hypothetical protein [Aquimarina sp. 2201CG5-10]MDY8135872.1 hypothetical protein [Aquimarina sp. 2201CG5-10]
MKNLINIIILLICSIPEILAQVSPDFTYDQNQVILHVNTNDINNFKVYTGFITEDTLQEAIPILGELTKQKKQLHFEPLVPFTHKQQYTLVYKNIFEHFIIDTTSKNYNSLSVVAVYPSSKTIPANILKWYIKFSHPVNEALIYNHIGFKNNSGNSVNRAILPLENALISDDGKLLTVWIEPGRQKRGLNPNKKLGGVFEIGGSYNLIISKKLKDQIGISMSKDYVHSFQVTEPDRTKPDINSWQVICPKAITSSNLIINCKETLDYGSSLSNLTIIRNGNEIEGSWQLTNKETSLVFTPDQPWKKGDYQILFYPQLEDLAGNNLERLFDQEIHKTAHNKTNPVSYYNTDFSIQ